MKNKTYQVTHKPTIATVRIAPKDDVYHTNRGRIFVKGGYDIEIWDDSGDKWAIGPEGFLERYEGPDELVAEVTAIIEQSTK
jgi:hypothetical protein